MASLPAQSWSPFRQSPSIDPHHPMVTQSPYQHLHRPPLSRNSSTGSDVGGSYREGQNSAASLQQQHRQNQFAAFQGNQQLRHSPYATRSDSEYQHNLSLAGNHHGEGNNLDGGEDDEGNPDFAQTIYDPFRYAFLTKFVLVLASKFLLTFQFLFYFQNKTSTKNFSPSTSYTRTSFWT